MDQYKSIKGSVSDCGTIYSLVLNRPKKMNALSFEAMAEIGHFIENIVNPYTSNARAVIFYGEGKSFTSGLDFAAAGELAAVASGQHKDLGSKVSANDGEQQESDPARNALRIYDIALKLQGYFDSLENCRVPVICALTGFCIGAGIDLSSACDIRICSKDAKFSIKEIDLGFCSDIGVIQRFPKVVGNDSWARELVYTARFFNAEEAH
jgi:enoyl-CoA hydratase/carnithine racemase